MIECPKCKNTMREVVGFTVEPIFYCVECNIVDEDSLSPK